MKASKISFEVLGKEEFIYCYDFKTKFTIGFLDSLIKRITPTAYITSKGYNLDVPEEEIKANSIENWQKLNEKYLK